MPLGVLNGTKERDTSLSDADYRDRYASGALLIIEDASDTATILEVVTRYNGTLSDQTGYSTATTYAGASTSSGVGQTDYGSTRTTTGDVDYAGGMRDDMQRAGSVSTTSSLDRDLPDTNLNRGDNTL